jgi:hypothetical protein
VGILALHVLPFLAGPIAASSLYSAVQRHYRNEDKSHNFERETSVSAKPVTGSDRKIDELSDLERTRIEGDNVREYRKRL